MINETERFAEKTTTFIRELAAKSPALRAIYHIDPLNERGLSRDSDVMLEKQHTVTKGLVCKYSRRALFLLSYTCAANCRYCERQDRVGVGLDAEGRLSQSDILSAVRYLAQRPDITEVIFSGGDPLTNMAGLLQACHELAALPNIRVLRLHTRFPMQSPSAVKYDDLSKIVDKVPAFYFSLHIDHPDELTTETEDVIRRLRKMGFLLLSQSVFLRGTNDDVDTLDRLFSRLVELGVRPYYIYHCLPIPTTMHFVMSLKDEVRIMSELRRRLSGLAVPVHTLELPTTTGKIAIPSDHWCVDYSSVRDFFDDTFMVNEQGIVTRREAVPQ